MNNRRRLLVALGAGVLTAPFGSFTQQSTKIYRIGILSAETASGYPYRMLRTYTTLFFQ
jgi:hypothetical protein